MPADTDPFQPGYLSSSAALVANAAASSAFRTEERLRQMPPDREQEIPIKLTSCDSSVTPARCAWTERTWQTDGTRYDKPDGRSGSTSFRPALLIGNGAVPPASFPIDTWGRLTVVANTLDQVLEVEWNCACAASGSGAGSGGGGTEVVSDCGTYSTVIVITLQDVSGTSGLDGTAIDIEWDGSAWVSASTTLLGSTTVWTLACVAGEPSLSFTESGSGTRVTIGGSTGGGTLGGQTIPGFSGTTLGISSDPGVVIGVTLAEG